MKIYQISTLKFYPHQEDGENEELESAGHDIYQALDKVDEAFKQSDINTGRDKKVSRFIEINGEIVGGIYSSLTDESYQDDTVGPWKYSFDIAIHPNHRLKQKQGLADRTVLKVIDEAMKDFESYKNELGNVYCQVWAVNPKLANILEKLYGFDRQNYSKDGKATLTKH